jgi:hypothetical protein
MAQQFVVKYSYAQHLCSTQHAHLELISDGAHVFGLDGSSSQKEVSIPERGFLHTGSGAILDTSE